MKRFTGSACVLFVAGMTLWCATSAAIACTGIRLRANDGAVVHARTMEFGADLDSNVIIVPRGIPFVGTTSSGKPGLAWSSKYAALGMNAQGQKIIADGLNEQGLAGGVFYLPGYAEYQAISADEESRSLASWELLTWILTNFANVDEVRNALPEIKVCSAFPPGWTEAPPVHYIVHDEAGNSLVIEYLEGKLSLQDNPVGVITNAPDFEWHLKNLSNYVNLSATNVPATSIDGLKVSQLGQGSGLLGVPGDFTPPSRFVRAAFLAGSAIKTDDGPAAVGQAFHILDSFDIPRGSVRGADHNASTFELTQWTTASDTKNRTFYFHTHENRRVRRLELMKVDLDAKQITIIPRHDQEDYQDLTPTVDGV